MLSSSSRDCLSTGALLLLVLMLASYHLAIKNVDLTEFSFSQKFLFEKPWLFVNGQNDDHLISSLNAVNSRNVENRIFMIGTSVIREGIAPNNVKAALKEASIIQQDGQLVDFSVSALHLLEALYLIHLAELKAGDRLYLTLSPLNVSLAPESAINKLLERRYLFSPDDFFDEVIPRYLSAYSAELQAAEHESDNFSTQLFLHNAASNGIAKFLHEHLYDMPFEFYSRYKFSSSTEFRQDKWQRFEQNKRRTLDEYLSNKSVNFSILNIIFELAEAKGASVQLLMPPYTQSIVKNFYGAYWPQFFYELKQRYGESCCVDLQKDAQLVKKDFSDPIHLRESGREKWTAAFSRYLITDMSGAH